MIISHTGMQYDNLLCLITGASYFWTEILAGFVNGLFLIFVAFSYLLKQSRKVLVLVTINYLCCH